MAWSQRQKTVDRLLRPVRRAARRKRLDLAYRLAKHTAFNPAPAPSRARVVVIGAGIGGLATALQLQLRGHDVLILEASAQLGGRAFTIREMYEDGLYADAGGFRFSSAHYLIREYLEFFGLSYQPFYPRRGDMLLYLDGQLIRRKPCSPVDFTKLPRELTAEEVWMLNQETREFMYRICGGVDRIVHALAENLTCGVQLHSEVRKIVQSSGSLSVEYSNDGDPQAVDADFVVCATPFSSLRRIDFEPALSDAKRAVVDELKYREGMLVYLQLPSEYWLDQGLSGFAVTDTVGELWTYGLNHPAGKCVTISYTKDEAAKELLAMEQDQRVALTRERCAEFLPWFKDFARDGTSLSWDEDRFIAGSRSTAMFLTVDQVAAVKRPESRIHFAGEHAATHQIGWMEGALESAHRVAEEITSALR